MKPRGALAVPLVLAICGHGGFDAQWPESESVPAQVSTLKPQGQAAAPASSRPPPPLPLPSLSITFVPLPLSPTNCRPLAQINRADE